MGNQMKEDEKIEKTIRGLLKLPHNRRCINCNSLGPQYVCTTFLTFVCTNCSGIQEFTHRVKSVSVSKFTAEEVTALQVGGNERAKQIYFKEWDFQRHSFPDSSNLNRLRGFIKHVYVDRKYTGARSTGLPRLRLSEKEESNVMNKYEPSCSESSSPCGKNGEKNTKSFYDERRSPRYSRENSRHGGRKTNSVLFEVVDYRFRDDESANHRFSHGNSKLSNMDRSCFPVSRPLSEILGDNVPTLQVGELKENDGKHADGSAHNQESKNENPMELKNGNSKSLIDFSTETENQDAAATSQTQQISSLSTNSSLVSIQSSPEENSSKVLKTITLETLLFELSVPSALPVADKPEAVGEDFLSTALGDNMVAAAVALPAPTMPEMPQLTDSVANVPKQSLNDDLSRATSSSGTIIKAPDEWPFKSTDQQQQPSQSFAAGGGSISQQTTLSIGDTNNESSFPSLTHNEQGSLSLCDERSFQSVSRSEKDASNNRLVFEPLPMETKYSVRKELPEDLFTTSYSSVPAPVSGCQTAPPHGMGFNYYPNTMPAPIFPNPARSTNPFDTNDERSQFPSLASLQGALPNLSAPTGLMHASSMHPQSPSIGSALSPAAYMGQEVHNNIQFTRPQGIGGFGSDIEAGFGSINTTQKPTGQYSAAANPESSSMGGNPFG